MKVVILAGGFGTRISEESHLKPKPMIEIGEKPILWHIMKMYSQYGFHEFVICCGYKQHVIKEWFADYYLPVSYTHLAMNMMGMEVGPLRMPLCEMEESNKETLAKAMKDYGLKLA